ncbi:hypothetical protein DFR49_1161 [Hephaestia caeni]|uniref:Uncharacterized protein n=1 Tax=Hephaestia caeni TaxID=645617 RepID=A0A397PH89_9SPHN|nr:hypothetical protein [Hephaestia caeni]RIA46615.1 hypothetical protein DFR49_1161 [Hephaestia caeni]
MNLLIAIVAAVIAVIVLIAVLKIAFGMIVLGIGLAVAVAAYFGAEKLIGKGR